MIHTIRELRDQTGLSQRAFAEQFQIPVSTLRKWEQGEASPPPYLVRLLAYAIPISRMSLEKVSYKENTDEQVDYFVDHDKGTVMDRVGNVIKIKDDLKGVNRMNLGVYLHDLFEDFHSILGRFERDCFYDRKDGFLIVQ